MPQITVEALNPDEEADLRELAEQYGSVDFLDFQDTRAVQMLARGCIRLIDRLSKVPPADQKPTKVRLDLR